MNEQKSPPETRVDTRAITNQLVEVSTVNFNLSQEIIVTTKDKVENVLLRHLERMESRRCWIAPLGVLITILFTLITSTFKDYGLSADTWRAIFIVVGGLSFVWFLWSIREAMKSEKIEDIVEELRQDSSLKEKS